jgi:hypothetical protein
MRRDRPLLAKEGNWTYDFCQQPVMICSCWVLLHAPKLGHGTDYLTSPPKEGMLRIFASKMRRLRPGLNPRTREPEASMLTSRPPKPLRQSLFDVAADWTGRSFQELVTEENTAALEYWTRVGYKIILAKTCSVPLCPLQILYIMRWNCIGPPRGRRMIYTMHICICICVYV